MSLLMQTGLEPAASRLRDSDTDDQATTAQLVDSLLCLKEKCHSINNMLKIHIHRDSHSQLTTNLISASENIVVKKWAG